MRTLLGNLWRRFFFNKLSPERVVAATTEKNISKAESTLMIANGLRLSAVRDHAGALSLFEQVLQIDPDSSLVYRLAGLEAIAIEDFETARDYFVLALHYERGNAGATLGLARCHQALGQHGRALALLDALIEDEPTLGDAWFEKARCQHSIGEFDQAIITLRSGLRLSPMAPPILNFLGLLLARELGDLEEGERCIRSALECAPGFGAAMSNLGWILAEQGRLEEAVGYFDQVLEANPSDQETRLMRAYAYLKHGNFAIGWKEFSARHASPLAVSKAFFLPELPVHASLAGKRVLIYAEQGLGDQIMFASCIPDFLAAGGRCVLECDVKLVVLFRRSFPGCLVVPQLQERTSSVPELEDGKVEFQLAMGSLPMLFREEITHFPRHAGYLRPEPERVLYWRQRLAATGKGPYVGISWQGGTRSTRRQLRSVPITQWAPILACPGQFFSLQYGECEEDIRQIHQAGLKIHHWPEAIADYDETAALVAALDLVISVCTAVVHLGGALGKEVWILTPATPEWRYMQQGDGMPWYPSAKLFRQGTDEPWSGVVRTVASELGARVRS